MPDVRSHWNGREICQRRATSLTNGTERVAVTRRAHYLSADHFGTRKLWLGIPAVVLSTLTVGLASIASALLASLPTFRVGHTIAPRQSLKSESVSTILRSSHQTIRCRFIGRLVRVRWSQRKHGRNMACSRHRRGRRRAAAEARRWTDARLARCANCGLGDAEERCALGCHWSFSQALDPGRCCRVSLRRLLNRTMSGSRRAMGWSLTRARRSCFREALSTGPQARRLRGANRR
jgi:hypothetical protein